MNEDKNIKSVVKSRNMIKVFQSYKTNLLHCNYSEG